MGTTHRGTPTGNNHRPNPRKSPQDRAMQAREESLGEASEYETEAKYAAYHRDSVEAPDERDEFNTGDNWSWLKGEFAENYRRGY